MGNLLRFLRRRPEDGPTHRASSSNPEEAIPASESDDGRAQTEANSLSVGEQGGGRRPDTAPAGETESRALGLRSPLQNTLEREGRDVENRTSSGNSEAAPSRQRGEPSTAPTTASGTVSKEGSQRQGYLKSLPRHERRRVEQEMRRKRKPGMLLSTPGIVVNVIRTSCLFKHIKSFPLAKGFQIIMVGLYHSVPGKRRFPCKRPCTAFQGATIAASHRNLLPGKCPCGPKFRVMCHNLAVLLAIEIPWQNLIF